MPRQDVRPPAQGALARRPLGRRLAGALLAVLLIVAAGAVAAQSASGADAAPPFAADLAFVATDGRVAWLPAGVDEVRRLGARGADHVFPVWSPDGGRIAAIARGDGGARAVVFDVAASPEDAVQEGTVWFSQAGRPVVYLDWSDDGRSLLLLVADPDDGFTLRRVGPAGDSVVARGAPLYWDQRPDGGLIVHAGGPSGDGVTVRDGDGGSVRELGATGAFRSPAASPSGAWLAYAERASGGVRRVVLARTNASRGDTPRGGIQGSPDRRALGHRGLAAFAWHPTRDLLALTRPLGDAPHSFGPLGGLDAETGMYEPWTDETVVAFWWAPGGDRIALLATDEPGGGQVAGASAGTSAGTGGGTSGADLAGPAGDAQAGAAGPTGAPSGPKVPNGAAATVQARPIQSGPVRFRLGMLDPSDASVAWLGEVTPGPTFLAEELPFFDQYARSHARWSPDGALLAIAVEGASGRETLGIVDAASGTVRELGPGAMPAWSTVPGR